MTEAPPTAPHASTLERPRRRRGPAPRLTRERIADAVIELGVGQLTVAAVAKRLGVAAGGLYQYVADRDDLVVAAADRVFAALPFPDASGWSEMLEREAWLRWDAGVAHPGLLDALRATGRSAPQVRLRYARCVHGVASFGLSPADAVLVVDTVVDLVADAARQAEVFRRLAADGSIEQVAQRQRDELGDAYGDVVVDAVRHPEVFFGRKLTVVLAGLAATIPASQQL